MVVDDHPVVRDGVALLLRDEPGLSVVGSAENGQAALALAPELRPAVVLLDLRLPDLSPTEVTVRLRRICPEARIVVFTAHGDGPAVQAVLDAGAHGCLLKDAAATDLAAALRRVLAGERVADPRIALHGPAPAAAAGLTRREIEVIRLAARGLTNPEIAARTGLARNTVKTYLQSALHKLGARNRIEAIVRAAELALL
nr:response regulator transcription factor [Pseudonocardia sp. C8]